MKKLKILLIGQPNVGKSSLLNAIVGPIVIISNYPGTTVEITEAKKIINNTEIEFVDTPGIYSISDRSEEEKVTEKELFEERVDGAIVIVDATALERSLYMVLQILEAGIPTILALNFVEDAEKKGIKINSEKLEILFDIPVVHINPLTKKGINKLLDIVLKIRQIKNQNFRNEYDDHIEKAISKISINVESQLPIRFVSLRVLEEDEDFYRYLKNNKMVKKVKENLKNHHPKVAEDIAITRYGTALFIAEKVTHLIPPKKGKNFEKKFDQIILHKTFGPLTTSLFLLTIFGILLYLGNITQSVIMGLTENLLSSLEGAEHSIINMILIRGLTGLAIGVSIALPYVLLFYLFLGLLEDVGILSRFIVNAERLLKKIGLPGKSFIPLALGLGCTAAATRATRVLSSKKEQFNTASLFAFVPCSSRIAIIMGVVGFYGGTILASSVFATLIIAGLIWAFGVKKIIHIKSEPLLLELPPYRRPLIKNVLAKSWIRMKDFVYIVIPLLALGGITYGFLEIWGFTNVIVEPLSPITVLLGLPAITIIPLIFSFLQKDLTGAMLISVLGTKISTALTSIQIYTFGVATTIGIPCIIALGTLIKEFGYKKAVGLTIISIIYGLLFAGLIWRIISIF
ncbi:MAG: ferrous iron transport protein B [Ignavibacteriales bacterium]|nr:ferrous iron transport protein B [Ignavibacteriales bacterium]